MPEKEVWKWVFYIRDGCYVHRHPNLSLPIECSDYHRFRVFEHRPTIDELARVCPPTLSVRERWGTAEITDPSKIFSENKDGIIGFRRISGPAGEHYIAEALEALVNQERLESFKIGNTTDSSVIQFKGEYGTVLHVTCFKDELYHIHAYGPKLTKPAKRRAESLSTPSVEILLLKLLEIPLFEKVGEILGVRKASPETLFKDETVGILQTGHVKDIEKVIEAFFAEDDITNIRISDAGEMEIIGSTQRVRIQYNEGVYFVFGYNPNSRLTPAAQKVVNGFNSIYVDPKPLVTFLKNQDGTPQKDGYGLPRIKVLERVIRDYGIHVWHGKNIIMSEGYHTTGLVSRRLRKPKTYHIIMNSYQSISSTAAYIKRKMAALLEAEFEQHEARELQFAGARFYRHGKQTREGYEECVTAYQEGIARGMCTALERIHRQAYPPETEDSTITRYEDAGDKCFREHYETKTRKKPISDSQKGADPEEPKRNLNRHERRALRAVANIK